MYDEVSLVFGTADESDCCISKLRERNNEKPAMSE
jgi:hypothetical protein